MVGVFILLLLIWAGVPKMISDSYFMNINSTTGALMGLSVLLFTGVLTWANPQVIGEYNVAMVIKSYRNGLEIDRFNLYHQVYRYEPHWKNRNPISEIMQLYSSSYQIRIIT